jgi:hypothetical protein
MVLRERAGADAAELIVFDSFRLYFLQAEKTIRHYQVQGTTKRIDAVIAHVAKEVVWLLRAPEGIPPRMAALRAGIGNARAGEWPLMDLGSAGADNVAQELAALGAKVATLEAQNKELAAKVKTAESNVAKAPSSGSLKQVEQSIAGVREQLKSKVDNQLVNNKVTQAETRIKANYTAAIAAALG